MSYVLFLNDWRKYPNAVVHDDTSNESWLFMSDVYAAMGVQNHFFHLTLLNPQLRRIDPFDPELTLPWKIAIAQECEANPWYYFREVARAPKSGSLNGTPLEANRGNLAVFWCFLNHVGYILIQIRQTGKSLTDDTIDNYIMNIAGRKITINKLTKDAKLRAANIARLKELRDLLPAYLNPYQKRIDKNNTEELTCAAYENTYNCFVGQASIAAANNVGRGHTASVARSDEPPFTANAQYAIPAMVTAGNAARDAAKELGTFYCTSYTTTAGKLNTNEGKFTYKILKGAMPWEEALFDCANEAHLHRRVMKHAPDKDLMVNITLNHRQMGKSDEWLYNAIVTNKLSGEEADRDMFNRWTSGGLTSPLDRDLSDRISRSKRDRDSITISDEEYIVKWFVTEEELNHIKSTRKIIIGNDTSMGVGKDANTLVYVDSWTGAVVATSCVNESNIWTYVAFVISLMVSDSAYILIPERRGNGQVLIDGVIVGLIAAGINPLERIYNTLVDSEHWWSDEMTPYHTSPQWWSTQQLDRVKRSCGYATSGAGQHARGNLYGKALIRAAAIGCDKVHDATLIDEINSLVIRNDRIDHAIGGHDDMVIAWLLSFWMLIYSRNLEVYGIEGALQEAREWKKGAIERKLTERELYEEAQAKKLKAEFDEYMEKLKQTDCPYTSSALERIIRRIYDRISNKLDNLGSIDNLIKLAKSRDNDRLTKSYDEVRNRAYESDL